LTLEELLQKIQAISALGETRSLTDDEITDYEATETQLKAAQKTAELRSRTAAYVAPNASLAAVVHVAVAKGDDTLERAFDAYLRTGHPNADLTELRALSVGTTTAGGYTVPTTLLTKLTEKKKAFGGVASAVSSFTTSAGDSLKWPSLDDTGNAGVIKAENTAPASGGADLVFAQKSLGAFTYAAPGASNLPLKISSELLADSAFDIQALIVRKLGERIARKQASDWVNGTGTTMPFGLATGTAAATNTFDNAAPTYADLLNVVHQVDPAYRDAAVWTFNDFTLSLIEGLVDANGRPLLNNANDGIQVGRSNQTLLGYQIVIDQAWSNYVDGGTNVFGAFGDLKSGYVIRNITGAELIVNPYSSANEGMVEFTLRQRADGVPDDTAAYRVLKNEVS
jgi:HK97 family phage major capsid protein